MADKKWNFNKTVTRMFVFIYFIYELSDKSFARYKN